MRVVRKVLAVMASLANAEQPAAWMLTDWPLLERFVFVRLGMEANTLRKDLYALLAAVRSFRDPAFSELDRRSAVASLEECLETLGRPQNEGKGRGQSAAVQAKLVEDEPKFEGWFQELEKKLKEKKLTDVKGRELSKLFISWSSYLVCEK
ncbi:hypothetical protein ONE63_005109 [Megalurothrips usitatus]|uniref:Uncharacterized protein n=1 Tax=Megalurothrips usitatus TaxID=439358 RepID=A0AAV7Y176_9NEOP|nr:hypothetical protein ONE63_005109 [Megalurothrips usitatus]